MKRSAIPSNHQASVRAEQSRARVGACNGCGGMPAACVCSRGPFVVPEIWTPTPGSVPPPGSGLPPVPVPLMLPRGLDSASYIAAVGQAARYCVPWADAVQDCKFMTELPSLPTVVAAGATVAVPIEPDSGWFDGYYVLVNAYTTATGAAVDSSLITAMAPELPGCPQPACSTRPSPISHWTMRDGCCCGRPYRTIAPAASMGAGGPLSMRITNGTAAEITVVVTLVGFCHPNRICF